MARCIHMSFVGECEPCELTRLRTKVAAIEMKLSVAMDKYERLIGGGDPDIEWLEKFNAPDTDTAKAGE